MSNMAEDEAWKREETVGLEDDSTTYTPSNAIPKNEEELLGSYDTKVKQEVIEGAFELTSVPLLHNETEAATKIKVEEPKNKAGDQIFGTIKEHIQIKNEHERTSEEKKGDTKDYAEKSAAILLSCLQRDHEAVINLAVDEGGLVNDDIRKLAWPILLGYSPPSSGMDEKSHDIPRSLISSTSKDNVDWHFLPKHRDEDQVALDVNRSFVYYPSDITPEELAESRSQLQDLIVEVLRRHPMLCYFQGFHDIAQVVLLVLGAERAPQAMEYISLLQIRDFMLPSLSPALAHLLLLQPILNLMDKELCEHIAVTQPYFALAATLTLYAHDIQVYSDAARLFDVFLAEDPSFPVYFFVTIILSRRDELLDIPQDEADVMHAVLSRLPKPLNLEILIQAARSIRQKHPPYTLSIWRSVSANSVLKTYNSMNYNDENMEEGQILKHAETYFAKQCSEVARAELRDKVMLGVSKHRRWIGMTVLMGVSAVAIGVYLGRRGIDTRALWAALVASNGF